MYKLWTLILSVVLSVSLAGCDGGPQPAAVPTEPSRPQQTEAAAPDSADSSQSAAIDWDSCSFSYTTRELPAQVDGQAIYGEIYIPDGAGETMPAMIFSHGYGGTHSIGAPYARTLAEKGFVVYCYDFRGGSNSSRSEGSPLDMSVFTEKADLEAVLSMLRSLDYVDGERIFLMGTSQGGMVSAMAGAARPEEVRGMMLLYPAFCIPDNARAEFTALEKVPALAAVEDTGFSDVAAGAWYAEAVAYCREQGLMAGIGSGQFSPEGSLTRAQLVTILWRQAGRPAVNYLLQFPDVSEGQWYTESVRWAASERLILGYGDGRFGTEDPITQEQLNLIFQRYTDQSVTAGIPGFDGSARSATRAQAAAAVMNYNRMAQPAGGTKVLIAYFTVPETSNMDAVAQASQVVENGQVVGNVEFIARTIQEETGGDIFTIETVQTYPGEHQALLDFAAAEMRANARPELSTRISNLDDYDVIFLGYPIWNADLPMPVYTCLDNYDLSGKTVIPFTAHGGSGFAGTISTVAAQEPGAQVERNGFSVSRNSVSAAKNDIVDWVARLGYAKAA